MPELMPIGHFARLSGLSARALRLYDEQGLLTPAATSLTTGYRYYSEDQLAVARRIGELRRLDIPLIEIRALLTAPDPQSARSHLAIHRAHLERQIRFCQQTLQRLQSLDDWYTRQGQEDAMDTTGTIYTCSFCSKQSPQVERMIAGPNGVIICNECVDVCNRIIAEERGKATPAPTPQD
jgi:DNA-binding transcriptional MerR regulator